MTILITSSRAPSTGDQCLRFLRVLRIIKRRTFNTPRGSVRMAFGLLLGLAGLHALFILSLPGLAAILLGALMFWRGSAARPLHDWM